jgi:acetyl esterase/lipase
MSSHKRSMASKVSSEMRLVRAVRTQISPAIGRGVIRPLGANVVRVDVRRAFKDIDAKKSRTVVQSATVDLGPSELAPLASPGWQGPPNFAAEGTETVSPSGSLSATFLTETPAGGGKPKRFLSVIDTATQCLVRSIDVTDVHGAFVSDEWFGGVSWSADELCLVYVAERKPPKRADSERAGWEFADKDDWGEQYSGTSRPSLFIASLASGRVAHLPTDLESEADATAAADREAARAVASLQPPNKEGVDEGKPVAVDEQAVGQPQLSPSGDWLVFTAWSSLPRRLGAIYCVNRPGAIWAMSLASIVEDIHSQTEASAPTPEDKDSSDASAPKKITPVDHPIIARLTPKGVWCRSARFSPDGSTLVWLQIPPVTTHNTCSELRIADFHHWLSSLDISKAEGADVSSLDIGMARPVEDQCLPSEVLIPRIRHPSDGSVVADGTISAVRSSTLAKGSFPGLFLSSLPRKCFTSSGEWILVESQNGFDIALYRISAKGGKAPRGTIQRLRVNPACFWDTATPEASAADEASFNSCDSLMLLDLCAAELSAPRRVDLALVVGATMVTPDAVVVVKAEDSETELEGLWKTVWAPLSGGTGEDWLQIFPGFQSSSVTSMAGGHALALPSFQPNCHALIKTALPDLEVDSLEVLKGSVVNRLALWRTTESGELPDPWTVHSSPADPKALLSEAVLVMPPPSVPIPPRGPGAAASPDSSAGRPVVLLVHGGPHSAFPSTTAPNLTAFLAAGYACVLCNYRGSTGYGEDSVQCLPGRVGDRDARDCIMALDAAARLVSGNSKCVIGEPGAGSDPGKESLDTSRVVVWGGSHGGILGIQIASQFPDIVSTACLRNPVVDIAAMATSTDIPDWCLTEATGQLFDPYSPTITMEERAQMHEKSLQYAIGTIKCPMLIGVGLKDRRVPPFNGKILHEALRAKGIPSRLLSYPEDNHPMASFLADTDFAANSIAWIKHFV